MKWLRWLAAGAVATAGFGSAAYAWPTSSYTSNMMAYNRATCIARANAAMAAEGWTARPSGGVGMVGHKEPSSAYILCLDMANMSQTTAGPPVTGTIVVVFVSSTAPNAMIPADEVAKLQQRMLGP
jgi:hypothetical protein